MAALTKSNRVSPGRLAFFSDESSVEAEARFSMEQALRQAIVRRELALFYQPVIDLNAGRVVGAEALLRWRHPELGSIPPAQFLPVLEQTGFIDEVGRWVLDTACRDAREFESLGLPGFRVGVNLSERQFRDPGLAPMVAAALQRHGLKPQRLELELTEASMMGDLKRTRETFDALAAIGVNVAIDDFGAGASSLGDLKSLTFSKLKIDRAFVTDVASRHDGQAICAALIELGRRLDIAVLAEGVETREEVEALRVLGCQLFQGFFFARPLPADKFVRKVADSDWLALISAPGAAADERCRGTAGQLVVRRPIGRQSSTRGRRRTPAPLPPSVGPVSTASPRPRALPPDGEHRQRERQAPAGRQSRRLAGTWTLGDGDHLEASVCQPPE